MILSYHLFLFTDFVIDSVTKFKLGYSFLFTVGAMAALNIGLLLKNAIINKLRWRRLAKVKEANIKER
jgi:4-amino-4-deoxy-L-arabinose transferase-like glycosyltransferase